MYLGLELTTQGIQSAQEPLANFFIPENRLPPVSTIDHMINRAEIFDSELARHADNNDPTSPMYQYQDPSGAEGDSVEMLESMIRV
jgi:hypothetical protein